MTTRTVVNHRNKSNGKVRGKATTVDATVLDLAPVETVTVVMPEMETAPPAETAPKTEAAPPVEPAPEAEAKATAEAPAPSATGESGETEEQPPKTPVPHSPQSEAIQKFLAESDDRLAGLEDAEEPLASLLPAAGISVERLAGVRDLYGAAQGSVTARGGAMVAEITATIDMQRARQQATIGMSAFRQVSRTIFPDAIVDRDARLALLLDAPMPDDVTIFVDRSRDVLAAARQDGRAVRLAAGGYDSQRLDALEALIDALDLLYRARRQAHRAAVDATTARNAAVGDLRTAMRQLRVEVAALLRAHPEVNPPADF